MISFRVKPPMASAVRRRVGVPLLARPAVHCRAFTLLELMLVLALIVAMTAIAWPSIATMFESQRLYKAADQIRAAWANARNDALTSGRTILFRFEPQTDLYTIGPWQGDVAAAQTESDDPAATTTSTTDCREAHLPEGVVFADSSGSMQSDSRTDLVETTDTAGQTATSRPIMFFPDGTTSTAQLQMTTARGQILLVELRGLTGISTVGEVNQSQQ
jgi:prepilin-type N-terminal cleavage/methylation domain-containing protein